jgi:hypothetical protein
MLSHRDEAFQQNLGVSATAAAAAPSPPGRWVRIFGPAHFIHAPVDFSDEREHRVEASLKPWATGGARRVYSR